MIGTEELFGMVEAKRKLDPTKDSSIHFIPVGNRAVQGIEENYGNNASCSLVTGKKGKDHIDELKSNMALIILLQKALLYYPVFIYSDIMQQ